jgi:uncharacterized protein
MKNISLHEKISHTFTVNTHSHHLEDNFFTDFTLSKLLKQTYVDWCGVTFEDTLKSRELYLNKVKYKSYYIWVIKAIKEIYNMKDDLTAETWDNYSDKIEQTHKQDKGWHKKILRDVCKYENILLDAYWNPGSDNNDASLFNPVFRVNPLFFGYSKDSYDHNGLNTYNLYDREFENIDEYLKYVKELIIKKKDEGCVALKIPIAYDRDLDFKNISKQKASIVFEFKNYYEKDVINFQDYLCFEICALAADIDIPVQIHTGMGQLNKTAPINLLKLIRENPNTKFVLFHGGFPWTSDTLGLLHLFPNVYSDICWLPILSPTSAIETLHKLIEVSTSDKIFWGCDTWTSEESYGSRLSFNYVLEKTLTSKIQDGYFSKIYAEEIVDNISFRNAKKLYKL